MWSFIKIYTVILTFQYVIKKAMLMKITTNNSSKVDDVKYILLWNPGTFKHFSEEVFIQSNCNIDNCFISSDRNMFGGDVRKFDAILFNGWDLNWYAQGDIPKEKDDHQKYAFVQRESAAKAYVCHTGFDNFFNWTITYKLDSDIIFPYIVVRDRNNDIVGPKREIDWVTDLPEVNETFATELKSKTKAAVWMYSNCDSSNLQFVELLQRALDKYGLKIDVYGKCAPLRCLEHKCDKMLKEDYYFYLALEESFAEDYVTDNILRALSNNVVPIVYGAANYSRFLPPESFLDVTSHTVEELAAVMTSLIKNQTLYRRYFRWNSYYKFSSGPASPSVRPEELSHTGQIMCDLCKALHDPSKFGVRSVYKDFRKWWYPKYEQKCGIRRTTSSPRTISVNENKERRDTNKDKQGKEGKLKKKSKQRKKSKRRKKGKQRKKGNRRKKGKLRKKLKKVKRGNKIKKVTNGNRTKELKKDKWGPQENKWGRKSKTRKWGKKSKRGKWCSKAKEIWGKKGLRRKSRKRNRRKKLKKLKQGLKAMRRKGYGAAMAEVIFLWLMPVMQMIVNQLLANAQGVRNAAAMVAVEVTRARASIFTNNFDIFRR